MRARGCDPFSPVAAAVAVEWSQSLNPDPYQTGSRGYWTPLINATRQSDKIMARRPDSFGLGGLIPSTARVISVLAFLAGVALIPSPAHAHGGGLDGLGCHHNREASGYHCHRGTLAGQSFSSKLEAAKTLRTSAPPNNTLVGRASVIDGDTIEIPVVRPHLHGTHQRAHLMAEPAPTRLRLPNPPPAGLYSGGVRQPRRRGAR